MRTRPLYRILLSVIFSCLLVMVIVAFVPMALQYQALTRMQATLGKVDVFTQFYRTLGELDEELGTFINNGDDDARPVIESLIEELRASAQGMTDAFHHPLFVDNQYLTESYLERAEGILNLSKDLSWEDRISCFLEYRKVHGYVLDNEWMLSSLRMKLIEKESEEQFGLWRVQFMALLFAVLVSCVALVLVTTHLIRRILRPIKKLTETIRSYKPGEGQDLSALGEASGIEETEILSGVFSEMVGQLEEKLETDKRNYELQMLLSETKLQLIESVVSPHFLFNCLATLSGLAYFENAPRTRELSLQIASYLRASLRLVGKEITLSEELEHTKNYLDIQKARFQERIEFVIDNDNRSNNYRVPAMILQPLAENAISHGLKDKLSGGALRITVSTGADSVTVTVHDNGQGLGGEELEKLNASIKEPFEPGKEHIGLHSVASRLEGRGEVALDSREGQYFSVRIVLPLRESTSPQG